MNLRVLVAATALPAIASVAYAQTTTPTQPSTTTTPSTMNAPSTAPPSTSADTATTPQWYQRQEGEWRSSKLVGSKVRNNSGDTVGDINEIILTKGGSAAAAVIGVGGFLGMGEHQVAVKFNSLQIERDRDGNPLVKLDTTKDALKNAPEWTWQSS